MSACEPVRRELQQSGQFPLRAAARGCVFQAVAGGTGEAGAGSPSVAFLGDRARSLRKSHPPSPQGPREGPTGRPGPRQMASACVHLSFRTTQCLALCGTGLPRGEPARCVLELPVARSGRMSCRGSPTPNKKPDPSRWFFWVRDLRQISRPPWASVCSSVQRALGFTPLPSFSGFPQRSTHRVA